MRTVLLAAAGTLSLVFAAHSAPVPHHVRMHHVGDISAGRSQLMQQDDDCMRVGAYLRHVAFTPNANVADGDDAAAAPYCSQYLSTQTLVQAPMRRHT